jgi:hypothetical protein
VTGRAVTGVPGAEQMGYDERTISHALGQKTIEMARRYARGADLMPKMIGVVNSFDKEMDKRRTKLSSLPRKVSNRAMSVRGSDKFRKEFQRLFGSGGGTRTPDTRIMMPQFC